MLYENGEHMLDVWGCDLQQKGIRLTPHLQVVAFCPLQDKRSLLHRREQFLLALRPTAATTTANECNVPRQILSCHFSFPLFLLSALL
jgi:hypothetical protein